MTSWVKSVKPWKSQSTAKLQVVQNNNMCENCHKKPKHTEGGVVHPFCSRSCARSMPGRKTVSCALRECNKPAKEGFAFCTEAHGRDAVRAGQVQACVQCKVHPRAMEKLCTLCDQRAQTTPRLREIGVNEAAFQSLKKLFESKWQSPKQAAKVERIIEITLPRDSQTRHDTYRKQSPSLQEVRTYHGSQCICDLGVNDLSLCNRTSCGICNAVRSSFRKFEFGAMHNVGRLGPGIYSYENPARADEFSTSCASSPYRVMIACNVIAPEMTPMQSPITPMTKDGKSSIFVANAEAIVPAYLVLYTR